MKRTIPVLAALSLVALLSACTPRQHGGDAPAPPSGQQPTGAPGGSGPVGQPQS
ncbi:hypothetical protein O3W44_06180 [Pantoea sp. LMR881]|uniref:hypothetical protein n=1 Tax=Pantoea sp. LMR881 TaxID=3014336 RepID=UPI0022B0031F|nr:hypothetical protein [Pantoea sp. LMR881]MCZ4058760.1 hypothetical protein [Pantoea sp. LMR881]